MSNIADLRKKAQGLSNEADAVFKRWETGDMPAEEFKHMKTLLDTAQGLLDQADVFETHNEMKQTLNAPVTKAPAMAELNEKSVSEPKELSNMDVFTTFLKKGYRGTEVKELNRIQADDGGILVPVEFVNRVILESQDINKLRAMVQVLPISGAAISMPVFDHDPSAPHVAENAAITEEDMDGSWGEKSFTPHSRAKMFRLSKFLLRDALVPVLDIISNRFAQRFAELEESDILNGTGNKQALGLLNSTFNPTAVTCTVLNWTTVADADVIVQALGDVVYGLREQYRRNASFIMSRDTVNKLRSVMDANNNPIYQRSLQAGQPPTLMGFPIAEVEAFATASSSGDAFLVFGDLKQYLLVERAGMIFERTEEGGSAFEQHQILFKMIREYDGGILDANAFIRLNVT